MFSLLLSVICFHFREEVGSNQKVTYGINYMTEITSKEDDLGNSLGRPGGEQLVVDEV